MKEKVFYLGLGFLGIVIAVFILLWLEHSRKKMNIKKLKQAVDSLTVTETTLDSLVPVPWDTLYFIAPYASKEEVEKATEIKGSGASGFPSEGGMSLVFVKDLKVTMKVFGYPENLGFDISYGNFPRSPEAEMKEASVAKITNTEKTKFRVTKEKDYISLKKIGKFPSLEKAFMMKESDLLSALKGAREEEVLEEWGRPDSMFSGMYGYIWEKDAYCIGVYLDLEEKSVTDVKTWTK